MELRDLIAKLQEIAATFPDERMATFIQMEGAYTDCLHVEHEFHDDWKDRYPNGRHTITLKGAA